MLFSTTILIPARLALPNSGGESSASPLQVQEEAALAKEESGISGYDEGFFIRSGDGSAEFRIEGLFQVLSRIGEPRREPSSDFQLKRMRPEFSGRFEDPFIFLPESNFGADETELQEAWIGAELGKMNDQLLIGRVKAPFGLEEVRSRRNIAFPQFSILNQFSPAEQHGVIWNGRRNMYEISGAV
jgi:hypothetical protein